MSHVNRLEALGRQLVASVAVICSLAAAAHAQGTSGASVGRVEFDYADGPSPSVEFNLGPGLSNDLFGIGDAAIAGVAEALNQSAGDKAGKEGTRMAAEQLEAARQIVQTIGKVVHGVRVQAYENVGKESGIAEKLIAYYSKKVDSGNWENIVEVRKDRQTVTVSAARDGGAIKGVFIVATDGKGVVLANVVCDLSPENVKKLTNVATTSGLQAGLGQAIEAKMRKMQSGQGGQSK